MSNWEGHTEELVNMCIWVAMHSDYRLTEVYEIKDWEVFSHRVGFMGN